MGRRGRYCRIESQLTGAVLTWYLSKKASVLNSLAFNHKVSIDDISMTQDTKGEGEIYAVNKNGKEIHLCVIYPPEIDTRNDGKFIVDFVVMPY